MSSIGSYAPASPHDCSARAGAGLIACAIILGLFVIAATFSAVRKDVTRGFDEVAHASYVAHLQRDAAVWPTLETMRMLDPTSFRFTNEANYLNHPPPFYALLARLGPKLEGHPGALLAHRFVNIVLAAIGLAAALAIGLAARLRRDELYAYAVPLACIPVLAPLAGAINNDNVAFAGGAILTFAAWQLVAGRRSEWLWIALAGMIAAAWGKLTGLMLAGGMVAVLLTYLAWRGRLRRTWILPITIALLLAAAPYLVFIVQYGSPVPNTAGQIALLEDGARVIGWANAERLSFPAYALQFVRDFVKDWMPTLAPRAAIHDAMLAIPLAALACALAGFALSLRRVLRVQETTLDVIVVAGTLSIAGTFAVHVTYSYGRHLATGWMMDAYPRYYLPLAVIVPLAGLSLLAAIESPRWRTALVGFLIAGPLVFRILGAPLE
jgi:hypothetical protein